MMSKQKIVLIIIAVSAFILTLLNISALTPETKNYEAYKKALVTYNNGGYSDAYYLFSKVTKFSKLKPAAIYRQALCADKLDDTKTEIKKYKEIERKYPNTFLSIRAKYLEAQQLYEDKNFRKAKKEFTDILKKYPKTDYATGSKYYLGAIEADSAKSIKNKKKKLRTEKKAAQYFKDYLKAAPTGRFALSCIQKWTQMSTKLNNEDNLLIAKTFQENQDYKSAFNYLKHTNLSVSWPYFVQNAYASNDYPKARYYTEQGLKGSAMNEVLINEVIDEKTERENIYKAIDIYLKISNSPISAISYLLSISDKAKGYDYLLYKNCTNLPAENQTSCFNTLYYKYPNGQFTAEALANIFYDKVKSQKYFMAKKIGKKHLSQFRNSNSAPKVMFWLGKVSERTKNYEDARSYYRSVIREYPDDYYAYRSFLSLNRLRKFNILHLEKKPVEFPYKNSGYGLIVELAKVKDYGLINQLCKDDEFVQSWLLYLEGDFSNSTRIARDAMEKLTEKPDRSDFRWRLVYPVHYYDLIEQNAKRWRNDPILILSIIREESYFNPNAKSPAGASGLMQLMPITAKEAGSLIGMSIPNNKLLLDPEINIRLGNIYYAKLKKSLSDKDILAVCAYNGGIGSVSKWKDDLNYYDVDDFIEQIPYPETKFYLKKVYKSFWNYLRIYARIRF